ncbi:MAG: hypothetical protein ACJARX_000080 [Psychroserpens sp.]|jgi:hypothetical protein|uniref:hypothetical protein n=1 Tax=Psychroserpens sp. TaxID=2020870 RepID=UPI0039E63199
MKNLLNNAIACAIVSLTLFSCSVESIKNDLIEEELLETPVTLSECVNQDPQAGITNNGSIPITFQIVTVDGTVLHSVENISPGTASGFLTFAPDDIVFNISKNTTGLQDEKVVFTMNQCMSFDIELGTDNNLVAGAPETL